MFRNTLIAVDGSRHAGNAVAVTTEPDLKRSAPISLEAGAFPAICFHRMAAMPFGQGS